MVPTSTSAAIAEWQAGHPETDFYSLPQAAKVIVAAGGAYNVTRQTIDQFGGKWDDDYAVFAFTDGSWGVFTDLHHGAAERTPAGEPLLRFVAGKDE